MHEIANWKHLEVKRIRMGGNRLAKPKSTFDRVKSISNELTILFNYIHPYLNEICINYELKLQCCYFDVWVSFCAFYYHISIYRGLRVFRYEIVWNRSERDYQRWVPFICAYIKFLVVYYIDVKKWELSIWNLFEDFFTSYFSLKISKKYYT